LPGYFLAWQGSRASGRPRHCGCFKRNALRRSRSPFQPQKRPFLKLAGHREAEGAFLRNPVENAVENPKFRGRSDVSLKRRLIEISLTQNRVEDNDKNPSFSDNIGPHDFTDASATISF
jgi:hypothetical protein